MISSSRNMMNKTSIRQLEEQGCMCSDWSRVSISEGTDLRNIRNARFIGDVSVGDDAVIINVPGGIENVRIGNHVRIINVARIKTSPGTAYGLGTRVNALDETGRHTVTLYPGLSVQTATLSARMPQFARERLEDMISEKIGAMDTRVEIGDSAEILDSGLISNVLVWPGVKIEGARQLRDGCLVNNSGNGKPITYVGYGADAENFIIEDGVVKGGCIIRNTYIGQGVVLDKGFTAHDSLFFANSSMDCGEACAMLCGPFTVSMHKSSLLIGCQTSFMNAGSGTNMSNHMYKLGPVNWGVLDRGVKIASNAYIMHGAHIGAYSLVMYDHKTHPDTSDFPFSYLFGDPKGATTVVPGAMLKSYGLKRDERKWPGRDRRLGHGLPLRDRITFPILNPHTVGKILDAMKLCDRLMAENEGEEIDYNGIRLHLRHLRSGLELYEMAIRKYISDFWSEETSEPRSGEATGKWIDVGGQVLPAAALERAMQAESVDEIEKIFDRAAEDYDSMQQEWIAGNLGQWLSDMELNRQTAARLDKMIEEDRINSENYCAQEEAMMALHS